MFIQGYTLAVTKKASSKVINHTIQAPRDDYYNTPSRLYFTKDLDNDLINGVE